MTKLTIRVENFKRLRSNSLFGFIDITIVELHLRIKEITVHESAGKRWVRMPAKPQITREGQARRDDAGKLVYSAILQFTDRATSDAFSQRAIEALVTAYPNAFADEAAA